MDAVSLGARLATALKAAGISKSEAARRLGIPRTQLLQWLNGRHHMQAARLLDLMARLALDWHVVHPESHGG